MYNCHERKEDDDDKKKGEIDPKKIFCPARCCFCSFSLISAAGWLVVVSEVFSLSLFSFLTTLLSLLCVLFPKILSLCSSSSSSLKVLRARIYTHARKAHGRVHIHIYIYIYIYMARKEIHPLLRRVQYVGTQGQTYQLWSTVKHHQDRYFLSQDQYTHPAWTGIAPKSAATGQAAKFKRRGFDFLSGLKKVGTTTTSSGSAQQQAKKKQAKK